MTSEAITVLGLGNLGRALAETFLRHGHSTTVWNRSAAKASGLAATVAATPAEAVADGDLVVVAVLDNQVAQQVLRGVDMRGRALVNLTSGTPDEARELARWAEDNGAKYLHGAVYAVPQTIGTAESSINYSGSPAVHERWQKQLALLGKVTFLGEDAGRASGYDVAILSGMYGLIGGFLHAAALARAGGIKAAELTPMMLSWLTDMHPALVTFAEEIDNGNYAGGESSLAMNQSGLAMLIRAAETQGVPFAALDELKALVDRQVADGHGEESLARAVESFRGVASQRLAG
ncbi:3-hydroxyisobutyrate dehydrogenase-like beta-hydroxyacid dehydrogenase [Lentzea atacamensis]|uniref:3-hydroxyisobutyrate dehydrogenase-like beta-hydroxyacid dehydrogenase n=1 Tax=Lentzea atacamensis TaxID=531938 RepID=A0A316ICK2_9PSEU|nr:NAD(P)-binding domain-containing protein [Lentzea atacamensis]PWK90094.1 3-hydroxyisobutyrate dehydrogenase-like beta-hydroxyacid dehydrogenase [Lentzea atacamensis]